MRYLTAGERALGRQLQQLRARLGSALGLPVLRVKHAFLGHAQDDKDAGGTVSFFGAPPSAQLGAKGVVNGFLQHVGDPVNHASAFTGGVGESAYTVGDLVRILKRYGLIEP